MRTTISKTALAICILAAILPQVALATTPSFSCSSNLVISLDNGYSASCDGDFAFDDGVLQDNTSINLRAGGFLNIGKNASLYAPIINFYADNINTDAGAIIDTGYRIDNSYGIINADYMLETAIRGEQVLNPKFIFSPNNTIAGAVIYPYADAGITIASGANISVRNGGSYFLDRPISSTNQYVVPSSISGNLVLLSQVSGDRNYAIHVSTTTLNLDGTSFVTLSPVPEPSSYALMLLGIAILGLQHKRKFN